MPWPVLINVLRSSPSNFPVQRLALSFHSHWLQDCPQGYFCVTGTINPQPCPAGSFGNQTKVSVSTDCQPCPGGKYCAGLGLTEPTGILVIHEVSRG